MIRLIVMLETAVLFALPANSPEGAVFPLLAYMAPNALFPMMGLLFWLRPDEYRPYVFLYTAGKIIGITANLGWLLFFAKNIVLDVIIRGDFIPRLFLGSSFIMIFLDGLCVLGGFLLSRGRSAERVDGELQ